MNYANHRGHHGIAAWLVSTRHLMTKPWGRDTHHLFHAPARAYAVELMRIGKLLTRDGRVVYEVWETFVMPHLVTRDYQPPPPRPVAQMVIEDDESAAEEAEMQEGGGGGMDIMESDDEEDGDEPQWLTVPRNDDSDSEPSVVDLNSDDEDPWNSDAEAEEVAAAATAAAGGLAVGAHATAVGLQARTDLNGREVRVVRWAEDRGRWTVKVVGTGEMVHVREQNLVAAPDALPLGRVRVNAHLRFSEESDSDDE